MTLLHVASNPMIISDRMELVCRWPKKNTPLSAILKESLRTAMCLLVCGQRVELQVCLHSDLHDIRILTRH